ncbi:MAG: TetR/AcrR family transcriptional regulator [Acidimicrobiia bacterium]|nr:TetR/AcrR family transcriptional regulator [Acidimicrobiia bacterium]
MSQPRLPAVQRRRQLLDVSLEVFARQGFHGTSMAEVAEAAGVTKPVLYQHFASKRELYLELLDDVGQRLLEEVQKATAAAGGPREQVAAGFAAYFRFVADNESAFRLLFGGDGREADPEFAEAVRRVEDAIAVAVAALIEADIDDDHRRLLAYGVVGMAEATSRRWVLTGRREGVDLLSRRVADLTWAGLRGIRPER